MKTVELVVVAVFTFFLMDIGASQCNGEESNNKAVIVVDVLHLPVVRLAAAVHETLSPFMTRQTVGRKQHQEEG